MDFALAMAAEEVDPGPVYACTCFGMSRSDFSPDLRVVDATFVVDTGRNPGQYDNLPLSLRIGSKCSRVPRADRFPDISTFRYLRL